MKKLAALAALALAAPVLAREVAGVEFPATVTVGDQELKLNGAGIRKKFVFKVYAGGLYLAEPASDVKAIVAADRPKRVRMVFLRDVDKGKILGAFREGFEKNSAGPGLASLLARLERIAPALSDMRRGGELFVTYVPGEGTTVAVAGGGSATVEGKDFADAMFLNWLGSEPADSSLKEAFLGR